MRQQRVKLLTDARIKGTGRFVKNEQFGFIQNAAGQNTPMSEGDMVKIGKDGSITPPAKQAWSAGDAAVDQGLNPFNQAFGGADGGSGGGDGAGSSGGATDNR